MQWTAASAQTCAQHREPMLQVPVPDWRRLDTNLTSAFIVGRAVARPPPS